MERRETIELMTTNGYGAGDTYDIYVKSVNDKVINVSINIKSDKLSPKAMRLLAKDLSAMASELDPRDGE